VYLTVCGVEEQTRQRWLAALERVTTGHLRHPPGAVRVREVRPRLLGVHASSQIDPAATDLPAYMPRDLDADLRTAIIAAAEQGGFVLLVGESSVGKSRALFEAVRAVLPDWWLIHPRHADMVRLLAAAPTQRTVVWLDQLQRYLDDGLPVGVVRELIAAGTVLVATMFPYEYAGKAPAIRLHQPDPHGNDRQLVELAHVIDVPDTFSAAERRQLNRLRSLVAREGRTEVQQALMDVLQTLRNVAVSAVNSEREGP
jgi:hypothetical protein